MDGHKYTCKEKKQHIRANMMMCDFCSISKQSMRLGSVFLFPPVSIKFAQGQFYVNAVRLALTPVFHLQPRLSPTTFGFRCSNKHYMLSCDARKPSSFASHEVAMGQGHAQVSLLCICDRLSEQYTNTRMNTVTKNNPTRPRAYIVTWMGTLRLIKPRLSLPILL